VEFELPGDEAIMHRDGDRLVIEPVRKRGLVALLKTMKPLEEEFPAIDD
jgi:antitoxin VapB